MNSFDNTHVLLALLISNIVGLLILFCCFRYQRIGRLLLFLLFIWAGYTNWRTVSTTPHVYVDYADYAFLPLYKTFINGWFHQHILLLVGFIATAQVFIGISMLLKGIIYRLGTIGGLLFLIGIIPLGIGSGFPFPIIVSIAFYLLFKQPRVDYLWKRETNTLKKTQLS